MEYSEQTPKPQIELERKEYDVPPEIIRPIGKWLEQELGETNAEIKSLLESHVLDNETNPRLVSSVNEIRGSFETTTDFIKRLQVAKEVKMASKPSATQEELRSMEELGAPAEAIEESKKLKWELTLSDKSQDEEKVKIKETEITVTDLLIPISTFIDIINDAIKNRVSPLVGHSELIRERSSINNIKTQAGRINEISRQIEKVLDPFQNAHEIRIEVDDKGKVNITPIKKPSEGLSS